MHGLPLNQKYFFGVVWSGVGEVDIKELVHLRTVRNCRTGGVSEIMMLVHIFHYFHTN